MTDAEFPQALSAWLDNYEREQRQRREQATRAQMEPFISWATLKGKIKCKPEVWARIRKLNPDHRGVKAYHEIRGYHPNRRPLINVDVVGPKEFIALYGRQAYRDLPGRMVRHDGHRKLITRLACLELATHHHANHRGGETE